MCGICGFVSTNFDGNSRKEFLFRMCNILRHRGPDDEGYFLDDNAGLGMRRLSIIDLETGQQPMTNEGKNIWLVFNGEIYNYKFLRSYLVEKGHVFTSKSDTEVIVHAYEEFGDRCVEHFNGMFAFALWDQTLRRLLIARDHLGIKPLYYWATSDRIVFGSELKAVIAHPDVPREIDLFALDQFLTLEYIPSPKTIFKGVSKLPAGHLLIYQDGELTVEEYWDIPFREAPSDDATCVKTLRELIRDAVQLQMVSDVPLGAFLSGGIDSSTVVANMSEVSTLPVKTFSIGVGDRTYNELSYGRVASTHFKTDHYEEFLEPGIADLAEKLLSYLDEPFGDFSIFPTYLVSMVARRFVKVVLSGDGGDEIFGGYDTYVAQNLDQYYRWLPAKARNRWIPTLMAKVPPQRAKKGFINKAKRFVEGATLPAHLQHARWMIFMNPNDKLALYSADLSEQIDGHQPFDVFEDYFLRASSRNPLAQQQYVDIKTYLVDNILTKVDRMSMSVSLETRVPLLDYRIVEFAVNLPSHLKIHRGQTKRILRQAMSDILPPTVLTKPKEGFSIPIKNWLREPLKPMMMDLLSESCIRQRGYFEPHCITQWIDEHLTGVANHSHRLWSLMVFELWVRQVSEVNQYAW